MLNGKLHQFGAVSRPDLGDLISRAALHRRKKNRLKRTGFQEMSQALVATAAVATCAIADIRAI